MELSADVSSHTIYFESQNLRYKNYRMVFFKTLNCPYCFDKFVIFCKPSKAMRKPYKMSLFKVTEKELPTGEK